MRSKHSQKEKFQIVMESLDHNTTQAEMCRRYGIFPTQLAKWKQQFLEGGMPFPATGEAMKGKRRLKTSRRSSGEQSLVIDAFKKRLQGRTRRSLWMKSGQRWA